MTAYVLFSGDRPLSNCIFPMVIFTRDGSTVNGHGLIADLPNTSDHEETTFIIQSLVSKQRTWSWILDRQLRPLVDQPLRVYPTLGSHNQEIKTGIKDLIINSGEWRHRTTDQWIKCMVISRRKNHNNTPTPRKTIN